jgi:diaminohydroxyphosphoribosylaminopyrimidine deaminase/5-amino-6-(5-phosphoribosylamino)uracil reductase
VARARLRHPERHRHHRSRRRAADRARHRYARQPRRIVVDSKLEIEPTARVLEGGGVWIFTATADEAKEAVLRERGAEIIRLANPHGKVDLPAMLLELGRRGINELHVEAGAKLNGSLLREGCTDELLVYLAPSLIGDARGMFDLAAPLSLADKHTLRYHDVTRVGDDLRIVARVL